MSHQNIPGRRQRLPAREAASAGQSGRCKATPHGSGRQRKTRGATGRTAWRCEVGKRKTGVAKMPLPRLVA
jgi:hypothetical protein